MTINAAQLTMILICNALMSVAIGYLIGRANARRIERLERECCGLSDKLHRLRNDLSKFMIKTVASFNENGINISEHNSSK